MIYLNFSKGRANKECFVLEFDKPLAPGGKRFVNSTDDTISVAKLHINDSVEVTLTMNDTTVEVRGKQSSAIEFTAQLTDEVMNGLKEVNSAFVTLDNSKIEEEFKVKLI